MKALVITTKDTAYVRNFAPPMSQTAEEVIGDWVERVRPTGLPGYLMLVDEALRLPTEMGGTEMSVILEHPDITYALRTGYPRPVREPRVIKCAYCDEELSGDDEAIDYDGDYVCKECFLNQLQEDLSISEIAKKLDFIVKTADEAAEEMEDDSE